MYQQNNTTDLQLRPKSRSKLVCCFKWLNKVVKKKQPNWFQNGAQNGAKRAPGSSQNHSKKGIRFWESFWGHFGSNFWYILRPCWAHCGTILWYVLLNFIRFEIHFWKLFFIGLLYNILHIIENIWLRLSWFLLFLLWLSLVLLLLIYTTCIYICIYIYIYIYSYIGPSALWAWISCSSLRIFSIYRYT